MTDDDPPYWFTWQMDLHTITVIVFDGVVLRNCSVVRSLASTEWFDETWASLVSKGYVERGYQQVQEETA